MKMQDLRGLSKQELNEKLRDLRKQFMELQFKRRTGVDKPHLFKEVKRDIARILTLLRIK